MLSEIIPSHRVANWLLSTIDGVLDTVGLSHMKNLEEYIYVAVIVALALFLGWLIRRLILLIARKVVKMRNSVVARELLEQRVLTKCSHVSASIIADRR